MADLPRVKCDVCNNNKEYNSTYFSSHKKSQKHKEKLNAKKVKAEQLKTVAVLDCTEKIKGNTEDIIDNIILKLKELKENL